MSAGILLLCFAIPSASVLGVALIRYCNRNYNYNANTNKSMAIAVSFSGPRRRGSPVAGAFFVPSDLSDVALLQALASISRDLGTASSGAVTAFPFQRKNARSLILKVRILFSLFEFLKDSPPSISLPSSVVVCLKELYILMYRSRLLLDYCSQCSRIWLLLQNPQISGNFHDLSQEIATILDVLPIREINPSSDLREQLQLLRRQARRSKLYVDPRDESLRRRIFSFVHEFEKGRAPDRCDLEFGGHFDGNEKDDERVRGGDGSF